MEAKETISFEEKTYNLTWFQNNLPEKANVTQVKGYLFNNNNELLIVKVGNNWHIPGGHPEKGETYTDTLNREILEEANIKVKNPEFIGYVKVVPQHDEEIHYQLRYTADIDTIYKFDEKFETSERKFVKIAELKNYIKWFDSVIFQAELKAANK